MSKIMTRNRISWSPALLVALVLLVVGGSLAQLTELGAQSTETDGVKPLIGDPPPMWEQRQGGTLIFGNAKEASSASAFTTTSSVDGAIKEGVIEPLLQLNAQGDLDPVLATSWDSNQDASEWTFHLRKGVLFHNGKIMTADDVIWSANYVQNPKNAAKGHAQVAKVESMSAPDKFTVVFKLKKPGPLFPLNLSKIGVLPVVPKESVKVGDFKPRTMAPGTGPFMWAEHIPGNRTVLERFDKYWGGKPYVEKVIYLLMDSRSTRENALRTGEIHIANRLSPIFAKRVRDGEIKGVQVQPTTLSAYRRLQFNVQSPLFKNRDLRLAVIHALDFEGLCNVAYQGLCELTLQLYPPGHWAAKILEECCPRRATGDLAKAKKLMAKAGYNGAPIRFVNQRGKNQDEVEEVARQLRNAGFNVDLQIMEEGVYEEREQAGDFDLLTRGAGWDGDPVVSQANDWHSQEGDRRTANYMGYKNPKVDELIADYFSSTTEQARRAVYRKLSKTLYDDAIEEHFGWNFSRWFGWVDKLKGFEARGTTDYTRKPSGGGIWRTYFAK